MRLKQRKLQKGQSVLEYVILSSLIGIFCLLAVQQFGKTIQGKIETMDKVISGRLRPDQSLKK